MFSSAKSMCVYVILFLLVSIKIGTFFTYQIGDQKY